jgi:hypothetical protein
MDQDTTKLAAALKAQLNQEPAEVAYAAALRAAISEARGGTPGWAEIDPVQVLKEERTREVESIRSFLADTDRRRKLEALSFQIEDSFGWKKTFSGAISKMRSDSSRRRSNG